MTARDPYADRTLEALGLAEAPRDHPLTYPGAWPEESGLLDGDRLLPLTGHTFPGRVPVLAVGSNACPGQLRHKMREYELSSPIPLVKARVTGLEVGVSAHVSAMGYVSASPFRAPGHTRELFLTWLDPAQLAAVDASEGVTAPTGAYDRVSLPAADVRIELESGATLEGAHLYVNRRGVLHDGTGTLLRHPGERPLLTQLLGRSRGCGTCSAPRPRSSAPGRAAICGCAPRAPGCSPRRGGQRPPDWRSTCPVSRPAAPEPARRCRRP